MRFLCLTLLSLVCCATCFGLAIYIVNPRGEFAPAHFPSLVLPDREAKLRLFDRFMEQAPPTGLVLGSSRSMKLKPEDLNKAFGGRFFNFAVTGASVLDELSIYRWVRRHGMKPQYLLIGLDVEAVAADPGKPADEPNVWLAAVPELMAAFEGRSPPSTLERARQRLDQLKEVFTWSYLVDAFRSVRLKMHPTPPRWSFDADGYVRYRLSESERALGVFDYQREISDCAVKYQKVYAGMEELSTRRRTYLETLIEEAQSDGAKVIIWVTPLHPQAKQTVESGTRYAGLVAQTVEYLKQLRSRFHVETADLHDPSSYKASESYWYDCVHFDEPAAERLITTLSANH